MNTTPARNKRWRWAAAVVLLAVIGLALFWWRGSTASKAEQAPRYLTQKVDRGDISRVVNATGALSPVNLVQVGSQVSGTIRKLHVDFNSAVQLGQLLAELDTAALDAELAQAQAQQRGAASSLLLANSKLVRSRSLFEQGYVSRAEVDEAEASLRSAQATVEQMQAAVARAANNRRWADIRSPVAGTVVSREVSVGQTVAASLQTPVLFKIAQDLREVQIEMNVSEADVGLMQEGQQVNFTVDAFVDRSYTGTVHQIRNNHQVQQNVVTYSVVVRARNDDLSLRPGMTCYVAVTVGQAKGTLRVPNAALRYEPSSSAPSAAVALSNASSRGSRRSVWRVGPDGQPQRVDLQLGIADSRHTQQLAGGLNEGDALIVGQPAQDGFAGPKLF
jgi:HlyD family secretion protein